MRSLIGMGGPVPYIILTGTKLDQRAPLLTGGSTLIVGPPGSGKTSLLNYLNLHLRIAASRRGSGNVVLNDPWPWTSLLNHPVVPATLGLGMPQSLAPMVQVALHDNDGPPRHTPVANTMEHIISTLTLRTVGRPDPVSPSAIGCHPRTTVLNLTPLGVASNGIALLIVPKGYSSNSVPFELFIPIRPRLD